MFPEKWNNISKAQKFPKNWTKKLRKFFQMDNWTKAKLDTSDTKTSQHNTDKHT